MSDEISITFALVIEHGREQEAADFYTAAFGARVVETHSHDGELTDFDMLLGTTPIAVAGANPKREANPALGGPFFPKALGAVSAALRMTVADLDAFVSKAVAAGATIRDAIQLDDRGGRSAAVFDPFGHIWGLSERLADTSRLAA
ncbi:VOC family protein [Brucella pseudintermedia]|uniref:VOC family protein n=1 Tax=Brucella pseudintermedia TaxID=370111 RepID=UPI00124BDDA2|nr:VOC family protein [Brucella pseudintermedia]KAB2680920.1 VOC family protein [Brucella pseudintermedia]